MFGNCIRLNKIKQKGEKMKTIIILATVMVLFITHSNSFSQAGVKVGFEGGVNFANVRLNLYGAPTSESNVRTGIVAGAFLQFKLVDNLYLHTGIGYIQKGTSSVNDISKIIQKTDYFEIPISLILKFPTEIVTPFFSAGAQYGFRLSAKQSQKYFSGEEYNVDVKKYYNATDLEFLFGGGLEHNLGKHFDIYVNFLYGFGTANVFKSIQLGTVRNRGMQLTTGVKF
ncbi:MAG: porin family protein [bacterium]